MASGRPAASAGAAASAVQVNAVAGNMEVQPEHTAAKPEWSGRSDKWFMTVVGHLGRLLADSGSAVIVCPWHLGEGAGVEAPKEELRMSTAKADRL